VAPNERTTDHLLASDELTFVSFFNHVKVQFSVNQAELTQFEAGAALRVRAPRCVLRLQRRMAYRVKTPVANSPSVTLAASGGASTLPAPVFRIADISATGFAFVFRSGQLKIESGETIGGCRVELTGAGVFDADIDVRRVTTFKDGFGRDMSRVGCRFAQLPGNAEMAIQCYVNRLTVAARKAGSDAC
jgi:c-di-GMP-binding flagellar brake protein YcgR